MIRTARAPLWPALSIPVVFVGAFAILDASASAAPRSQSAHPIRLADESVAVPWIPVKPTEYLRVTGPGVIRLVERAKVVRAPRPVYPPNEELARDPEAYAAAEAERRSYGGVALSKEETSEGINISVGGDILPEVTVSPYSRARIRPEDVVLFFKDEELDGLRGGIAYPAARLRFDPARRDVRASSSATYTSQ
jgi:hypothetical protein